MSALQLEIVDTSRRKSSSSEINEDMPFVKAVLTVRTLHHRYTEEDEAPTHSTPEGSLATIRTGLRGVSQKGPTANASRC
ncbi:MAG: hypothetical protein ACFFGZ_14400 [Candidatus Thorarchaeota archaeon]